MKHTFKFLTVFLLVLLGANLQPAWGTLYIQGNFTNWENKSIEGSGYTTGVLDANTTYYFKITDGSSYSGADLVGDRHNGIYEVGSQVSDQATFTLQFPSKVNFKPAGSGWNITVFATPDDAYLAGNFWGNDWQQNKMTYDSNTGKFSYTLKNKSAGTYTFRITHNNWEQYWGWTQYNANPCCSGGSASDANSDNNINFTIDKNYDIVVTFNPDGKKICITASDPATEHTFNRPYIYFLDSKNWGTCGVIYGRGWDGNSYTKVANMSKVANTSQLYYVYVDDYWNKIYNQIAIINKNKSGGSWEDAAQKIEDRWGSASHTGVKYDYDFNYQSTYYITSTGPDNINISSDPVPIYTAYIKVKKSEDGGSSYLEQTYGSWPATINMKGTIWDTKPGTTTQTNFDKNSGAEAKYEKIPVTGEVVMTLKSTDDPAYEFKGWGTGSTPSETTNPKSYNITANTTYYAFFARKQFAVAFAPKGTYGTSTVTATAAGSSITTGNNANYGSRIVFTATPAEGYVVEGWFSDVNCEQEITTGISDDMKTYTISSLTNAATAYVKFKEQGYQVTFGVHESGHGSLGAKVGGNAISTGDNVPANSTVTFTATPATADYVVEGWYSNAACTSRIAAAKAHTEYSITLTENTEVYVKFAQAYTVHFGEIGDLIDKGELAVTYYDESIVDGAQVAEGSNVVFSATNLASNYTVQGWFADQQATNSLEGVSGYEISPDRKTLTATISKDVNVYVRYFAPETVSAITLKVDGSVPSVYQIGETITAEPTTTGGDGNKVYNWQLKQDGVPVSTTFTADGKKVSFNVESIGNYTITLTINDATTGFFNSTCTSAAFAVNEPVYYIIGASFWGTSENDLKTLHEKAMSGEYAAMGCKGTKDVHLQPTMEKGVYSFGAWRYGNEYYYFWIYDAVKQKVLSNSNSQSYYLVGGDHKTYDQGVQLTGISLGNNSLSTKGNNDQYTDLGQEGHNWYMYIKNNKMWFTENAPDLTAYVRLVVTADKQYYSNEILMPEDGAQSEILSFYSKAGATYKIQKQEPGKGWTDLQVVTDLSISEGGIYTITFTKSGNEITMGTPAAYTGDYYVRTDALNSWDDYKTNPIAKMRYTEGARNNAFNYYLCKWCDNENINVHFAVANDYNSNLLGTYTNDVICTEGKLLGQKASVRFMFMHKTGELARAYLCGTIEDQFLRVINNQSSGKKIYSNAEKTQEVTDLKFEDSQDFVYPIDVYAQPGAQIALRAKYKNYYQFFYGTGSSATGDVTGYDYLIGNNESTDNNAYHMQMVYDFKTDRLVAGWIPGNDPISGKINLHSDAIITREHQGDLRSIRFENDESGVFHVKTLYAELQLNKSEMTDGHTQEAEKIYERNVYWISFPFDVRVGDIFGVDGYGTKWVIQKYNGAKRAQIGWFAETSTFWEQMDEDDIMEANVGYSLNLDPDYFDQESDEVWSNGKASVSFRFPSMIHNFDVISNGTAQSIIPKHTCTIDRTFGDGGTKNHKETDSNWNVFGIPTFQDLENPIGLLPFESYYEYVPATNSYTAQATTNPENEFTLRASYSYFIQWGQDEDITWPKASIINKLAAAPYHYADEKNYMVELFFSYGDKEDHTYINLKDEAKQDFVLNEDMMKVTNSGQPNIYSFAGAYDVAYNATAFENQTVNLGVIARKNGSYTFAMPKDFSGKAVLVDLESGEATDLNLSNYTVELNKGTYNNRFQLLLEVEAQSPTNMNPTKGEWSEDGKTKKLLINDNIYLINAGRIYNASGTKVK